MSTLHLIKSFFLKPVLRGLDHRSVDSKKYLRASGLHQFDINNQENYLPAQFVYSFMKNVSKTEQIRNLGSFLLNDLKFVKLSNWGDMIISTPDLFTSVKTGARYNHVLCTHQRAEFHINGNTASYSWTCNDKEMNGRDQVDYLNLFYAIDGIRVGAGSKWTPLEIHTICSDLPDLDNLLPVESNTVIRTNSKRSGIMFETSLLSTSMPDKSRDNYEYSDKHLSIQNKIYCILDGWSGEYFPVVDVIAEMGSISRVTLYRMLHSEGTSYIDILDNWRFTKALKLLNENDHSTIKEISQKLKYSNCSNFERSFKRWTGTTPGRFRDSIRS
jgi:AraC-like DNA-binding protein